MMPRRWVEICALADIPKLGSRVVAGPQGNIAVFRTAKDRLFALDDRCPHKGGPLSQGIVHGETVACPLHNWQIALDTGVARGPDVGCRTSRSRSRRTDTCRRHRVPPGAGAV